MAEVLPAPSGPGFVLDLDALLAAASVRIGGVVYKITLVTQMRQPDILAAWHGTDEEIAYAKSLPDAHIPEEIRIGLSRWHTAADVRRTEVAQ